MKNNIIESIIGFILLAMSCFLATGLKTPANYMILTLSLIILAIYLLLLKKFHINPNILFNIWFFAVFFLYYWMIGYSTSFLFMDSCFVDNMGETRCVMPTGQLLIGFMITLIATPLTFFWYRKRRNHAWEIIWQLSVMVGVIIGIILDVVFGVYF